MRKALLILLLFSSPAFADYVYNFGGAIDSGGWNGFAAGTPITGSFTIGSNTPPNGNPDNGPAVTSYDALKNLTFKVEDYTFSLATDWTWTVNDSAFGTGDFQGTGSAPVNGTGGYGGAASLTYAGEDDTFDGAELSNAGQLQNQPWTVKRWALEVYGLGVDAAEEAVEIGGDIFYTTLRPDTVASVPTHDKYGTRIGTMKDGYPAGSD